jgi:outer membrane receptor protein involved in Fe transport
VTNYRFSEGALKGVGVGSSLNYRSARTIGYLATSAGLSRPDAPIKGATSWDSGLWISYARTIKLTAARTVRWRVQLNVRNVLDDRDLEPITGVDDGAGQGVVIRWRVPEPRTFAFSNTFEF